MRRIVKLAVILLATTIALGAGQASAGSWKSKKGKSKAKYEQTYEVGECSYKLKPHARSHGKKMKCRSNARYSGGPPPWAPAHGYRVKKKGKHYSSNLYIPPFDLSLGRCNRTVLGAVLGGGAGAVLGSRIGSGDGRTAAILGGTILGILVGGNIGQMMDELDQNCVGQTLEHAPDGQAIIWNDEQTGAQYQVAPVQTIQTDNGQYCREYTATATLGGQKQETYGMACRQADGSWQIRS